LDNSAKSVSIAEVILEGSKVSFKWNDTASTEVSNDRFRRSLANGLRWCQLVLDLDGQKYALPLGKSLPTLSLTIPTVQATPTNEISDTFLPNESVWQVTSRLAAKGKLFGPQSVFQAVLTQQTDQTTGTLVLSYGLAEPREKLIEAPYRIDVAEPGAPRARFEPCTIWLPNSTEIKPQSLSPMGSWEPMIKELTSNVSEMQERERVLKNNEQELRELAAKRKPNVDDPRLTELEQSQPQRQEELKQVKKYRVLAEAELKLLRRMQKSPLRIEISIQARYKDDIEPDLPPVDLVGP
jgi:hypothetical protein